MTKLVLSVCSIAFLLFSVAVQSHSNFDDALLEQRCNVLVEKLNELEIIQYKSLCKFKLTLASNKIGESATKIHYRHYKEAESLLASSIRDLKFAADIHCALTSEINEAKMEASKIQEEVGSSL